MSRAGGRGRFFPDGRFDMMLLFLLRLSSISLIRPVKYLIGGEGDPIGVSSLLMKRSSCLENHEEASDNHIGQVTYECRKRA